MPCEQCRHLAATHQIRDMCLASGARVCCVDMPLVDPSSVCLAARVVHRVVMSKRKSTNATQSPFEAIYQSGGKAKSNASFQLDKCNVCQVELTKRDKKLNHDEDICKGLIESRLQLGEDGQWTSELNKSIFQCPFLLDKHILYTDSARQIAKDKLKDELLSSKSHDNLILLPPELMQHCSISEGQLVSVHFVDSGNSDQRHHLEAYSYDQPKSALSVDFVKESRCAKSLFTKDGAVCSVVKIDFHLSAITLQSLNLQIEATFADPFKYLDTCCSIKKGLAHETINPSDENIKIVDSKFEYNLTIRQMTPNEVKQLENNFCDLDLSGKLQKCPSNIVYVIGDDTKIIFSANNFPVSPANDQQLVGYATQMELLEKFIIHSLDNKYEADLPRTILLTGSSGTGKTLAMKHIFSRFCEKINLIKIHSSMFMAKNFEFDQLRKAFQKLAKLKPSLLFVDNLEDLCNQKNATDKRWISWFKLLLDDLPRKEPVVIVGATSSPELLDTSLRRPGRFDMEVEFPIPSPSDRNLIIKQIVSLNEHCLEEGQISSLAESAHGFTGADLKHLCEKSLFHSMDTADSGRLTYKLMLDMLRQMKPSIMREITLEKPNVKWSDIGGMHTLRHLLEETVVWPVKYPERFVHLGIEPPRGILMYGPPGCCKTMIGKALANESGLNFFSIKGPELFSKWVGESERAIREMFRKARTAAPSILFFDEIDALAAERGQTQSTVGDRVLAQLLTEIDGVEKLNQVVIVAATNRPDIVDKALLRPGRLDSMVYVPLPDLATRREIFQIRATKMRLQPCSETEHSELIEELAQRSEGYTGAEVNAVCQRAGLIALSESLGADCVTRQHFLAAFERVRAQTERDKIAFYDQFANPL